MPGPPPPRHPAGSMSSSSDGRRARPPQSALPCEHVSARGAQARAGAGAPPPVPNPLLPAPHRRWSTTSGSWNSGLGDGNISSRTSVIGRGSLMSSVSLDSGSLGRGSRCIADVSGARVGCGALTTAGSTQSIGSDIAEHRETHGRGSSRGSIAEVGSESRRSSGRLPPAAYSGLSEAVAPICSDLGANSTSHRMMLIDEHHPVSTAAPLHQEQTAPDASQGVQEAEGATVLQSQLEAACVSEGSAPVEGEARNQERRRSDAVERLFWEMSAKRQQVARHAADILRTRLSGSTVDDVGLDAEVQLERQRRRSARASHVANGVALSAATSLPTSLKEACQVEIGHQNADSAAVSGCTGSTLSDSRADNRLGDHPGAAAHGKINDNEPSKVPEPLTHEQIRDHAALVIQKMWKGCLARRFFAVRRLLIFGDTTEYIEDEEDEQSTEVRETREFAGVSAPPGGEHQSPMTTSHTSVVNTPSFEDQSRSFPSADEEPSVHRLEQFAELQQEQQRSRCEVPTHTSQGRPSAPRRYSEIGDARQGAVQHPADHSVAGVMDSLPPSEIGGARMTVGSTGDLADGIRDIADLRHRPLKCQIASASATAEDRIESKTVLSPHSIGLLAELERLKLANVEARRLRSSKLEPGAASSQRTSCYAAFSEEAGNAVPSWSLEDEILADVAETLPGAPSAIKVGADVDRFAAIGAKGWQAREQAIAEQEALAAREAKLLRQLRAATYIQSCWRRFVQRHVYLEDVVVRRRRELQSQRDLKAKRIDEISRLSLQLKLGSDLHRCCSCDEGAMRLDSLLRGLRCVCTAVILHVRQRNEALRAERGNAGGANASVLDKVVDALSKAADVDPQFQPLATLLAKKAGWQLERRA